MLGAVVRLGKWKASNIQSQQFAEAQLSLGNKASETRATILCLFVWTRKDFGIEQENLVS